VIFLVEKFERFDCLSQNLSSRLEGYNPPEIFAAVRVWDEYTCEYHKARVEHYQDTLLGCRQPSKKTMTLYRNTK
jgi:hypothetical protein